MKNIVQTSSVTPARPSANSCRTDDEPDRMLVLAGDHLVVHLGARREA